MPTPKANESREDFMKRCIPIRHGEHPSEDNKQSVAVCFSIWKEHHKNKAAKSEKMKDEFMKKCMGGDESKKEDCMKKWEEKTKE
jgi:hypothetical protein